MPAAPVLEQRFEVRLVCPAELGQPVPARVSVPDDAIVRANEPGDAYLDAKDAREDLLEARLNDAHGVCEAEKAKAPR